MLERVFKLSENRTTARTETLAGLTTFLTMAYIIFVQPAVLPGKCLARIRVWTSAQSQRQRVFQPRSQQRSWRCTPVTRSLKLPEWVRISSLFFQPFQAATAAGFRNGWQVALGVVFVSGVLFLILSLVGLRELIFNAISPSLKNGIAAGIGLFIAFIGLQQAGVIVRDPGTAVKLNAHFASPDSIVFFVGMLTTAVLHARRVRDARRVRGSILWGDCRCHNIGVSAQAELAAHARQRLRGA